VLHNAELVESYRERQVNKRIVFVNASILNSGFEDGRFDIIALRHVIHHLVGNDLAQTRRNQEAAIRELFRILRPGGLLLIEEQVNNSELACRLVFFLSNLASKLKLRVPFFEVTPNTIVGFLTRRRLEAVCRAHGGS
jgi:SAM-dependent methyltransferase